MYVFVETVCLYIENILGFGIPASGSCCSSVRVKNRSKSSVLGFACCHFLSFHSSASAYPYANQISGAGASCVFPKYPPK